MKTTTFPRAVKCVLLAASTLTITICALLLATSVRPCRAAGPTVGACDTRSMLGFCYEYSGPAHTAQGAATDCAGALGGKRLDACPTEETVGVCVVDPGGDASRRLVYVYYRPAYDQSSARAACPGRYDAR